MSNSKKQDMFSSKIGFILSCIGAAIGLGNIWMFPYKLGSNGGASFLIPYFLFVILFGMTGLVEEFSLGRLYKSSSMKSVDKVLGEKNIKCSKIISVIPTIGLLGIFMFYTVVIGWVIKYILLSLNGSILSINADEYFSNFMGSSSVPLYHGIAVLLTLIIVCFGISKGIEKINKIIIPLLFIIFMLLIFKSLSLPGSYKGIEYLLKPDWSYLLKPMTWVMALGQAFFTVSLTGCCMVMCGSYTDEKFDIPSCAINTAIFDTCAAMLAAFMIMPAVFAYGMDPMAGPKLLFVTVPTIFQSMKYGSFLSLLFFISILFASISSSIAILEGPVQAIMEKTNWSRKKSATITALVGFILALPLGLSPSFFDTFTNFITIVVSPLGALITAITFFYFLDKDIIIKNVNIGSKLKLGKWFVSFGRYVFVPGTMIIIVLGIIFGGIG